MITHDRDIHVQRAQELLTGAVDLHVHSGPSITPRSVDHIDMVEAAQSQGFRAVVIKDHENCQASTAKLLQGKQANHGFDVFSGVVISNETGGFNPYAVEYAAQMGGKVVWLPTLCAENHLSYVSKKGENWWKTGDSVLKPVGIPALTNSGEVRDEVKAVLDVIARHNMLLAGGHLHVSEIFVVFEEARRRGVSRLMINHPEEVIGASVSDSKSFASDGVYIEHCLSLFLDSSVYKLFSYEYLKEYIDAIGPDMTILSSDLGQKGNTLPVDGMREGIAACLDMQIREEDIRKMVSLNAAKLIGISL